MSRRVRVAALLALGLLAGLPAWLGWRAEKTFRASMDELALVTGAPVAVRRYDRGWLQSDVESELRAPDNAIAFRFRLHLDHGPLAHQGLAPVMAYVRGEIQIMAPAAPAIAPLTLEGTTDLGGVTRLALAWPAARLALADLTAEWQPLHGELHYERDARRLAVQLESPMLRLSDTNGVSGRADSARLRLDLRPGPGGVPLGRLQASAARLDLPGGDAIEDGRLSLAVSQAGDSLTLAADAQLQTWQRHGTAAGPGRLAVETRRLDPAALPPLLRLLPALARGADAATAAQIAPLATQIARRAPAVELTALRLGDAPAALDGRGRLAFDARVSDNASPARLLTRLAGEFELNLPAGLAHGWLWPRAGEAEGREASPLPSPYDRLFTPAPDGYRLRATLKQGRLLVNGEPWHGPLPSP